MFANASSLSTQRIADMESMIKTLKQNLDRIKKEAGDKASVSAVSSCPMIIRRLAWQHGEDAPLLPPAPAPAGANVADADLRPRFFSPNRSKSRRSSKPFSAKTSLS